MKVSVGFLFFGAVFGDSHSCPTSPICGLTDTNLLKIRSNTCADQTFSGTSAPRFSSACGEDNCKSKGFVPIPFYGPNFDSSDFRAAARKGFSVTKCFPGEHFSDPGFCSDSSPDDRLKIANLQRSFKFNFPGCNKEFLGCLGSAAKDSSLTVVRVGTWSAEPPKKLEFLMGWNQQKFGRNLGWEGYLCPQKCHDFFSGVPGKNEYVTWNAYNVTQPPKKFKFPIPLSPGVCPGE